MRMKKCILRYTEEEAYFDLLNFRLILNISYKNADGKMIYVSFESNRIGSYGISISDEVYNISLEWKVIYPRTDENE